MASSGRLRDIPNNNFPPSKQQRRGVSKYKMDVCDMMTPEKRRGLSISSMVEEPTRNIREFLATNPEPYIIADVLGQYRAFVIQLAAIAHDTTPTEALWKSTLSDRAKQLAQRKFQNLKPSQPRVCTVLEAYRDAVDKLDRALRQHTESPHAVGKKLTGSTSSFLDVGKMVSSGIDLLFGDSSNDVLPPLSPNHGWNAPRSAQSQEGQRLPAVMDNRMMESAPDSNTSAASRASQLSNQSFSGSNFNEESRAAREARRQAMENVQQHNPSEYDMVREPISLPAELTPKIVWSSRAQNSAVDQEQQFNTPTDSFGTPIDPIISPASSSSQDSPNKPVPFDRTTAFESSPTIKDSADYAAHAQSQPTSPSRRQSSIRRPQSVPSTPRQQNTNTVKPSGARSFSAQIEHNMHNFYAASIDSGSRTDDNYIKTVISPTAMEHAMVKRELNNVQTATLYPQPKVLRNAKTSDYSLPNHQTRSGSADAPDHLHTYKGGGQQTRSPRVSKTEQRISFNIPTSSNSPCGILDEQGGRRVQAGSPHTSPRVRTSEHRKYYGAQGPSNSPHHSPHRHTRAELSTEDGNEKKQSHLGYCSAMRDNSLDANQSIAGYEHGNTRASSSDNNKKSQCNALYSKYTLPGASSELNRANQFYSPPRYSQMGFSDHKRHMPNSSSRHINAGASSSFSGQVNTDTPQSHDCHVHTGGHQSPQRHSDVPQSSQKCAGSHQSPHRYKGGSQSLHRHKGGSQSPHRHEGGSQSPHRCADAYQSSHLHAGAPQSSHRHTSPHQAPHGHTSPHQAPHRHTSPHQSPHRHADPPQSSHRYADPPQSSHRHAVSPQSSSPRHIHVSLSHSQNRHVGYTSSQMPTTSTNIQESNPYVRGQEQFSSERSTSVSPKHHQRSRSASPSWRKREQHSQSIAYQKVLQDNERLCELVGKKDSEIYRLIKDNQQQWNQYLEKVNESARQLKRKSAEAKSAHNQVEKTKDLLQAAEAQLVAVQNELADCQQELEKTQRSRKLEESTINSEVEDLERQLAQANDKRRAAEVAVSNCEAKLNMSAKNIQRLSSEKENLVRENRRISQEVKEVQAERAHQELKMHNYEARYKGCVQEKLSLQAQCEELEEELAAYTTHKQRKEKTSGDEAYNDTHHLTNLMKELTDENKELHGMIVKVEKEKALIEETKVKTEKKLSRQVGGDYEVLVRETRKMKEEISKLERRNTEMQGDKQKVEMSNVHLREELKELTEKYCCLESDMAAMRKEISEFGIGIYSSVSEEHHQPLFSISGNPSVYSIRKADLRELKRIIDSLRENVVSEESWENCSHKYAKIKKISEELQNLYSQGTSAEEISGETLSEECDFLRKENDRLNDALKTAFDQIRNLKPPKYYSKSAPQISVTVSTSSEKLTDYLSKVTHKHAYSAEYMDPPPISICEAPEYIKLLAKEQQLERRLGELNKELQNFEKKKKKEFDSLSKLLDMCASDKKMMADKDKKTINEKNAEIKRLTEELAMSRDESVLTNYQACVEENEKLQKHALQLQQDFDLQLKQSADFNKANLNDIEQLKKQITYLEMELSSLREKHANHETIKEKGDLKDMELTKLRHELQLAQKDIEIYHKGQSPNGSTAYIVRMRDQSIVHLHEMIADLERFNKQCRDSGFTPPSPPPPHNVALSRSESLERADKSEMLLIMTDETTRMKEKIEKLEYDNVKLIELLQQRDAKIFELKDENEWLVRGSNQQELITTYTQKLKEGEEEMGKLHQTMEVLTKKHSSLLLAKENEILEVRTHYATQLSQLINDCASRNECQEDEMKKLCVELDNLEKRNFELERALREYDTMKSEQLPKLRSDLESLRKARSDLRGEFEQCNQRLKETQRRADILEKEKIDTLKNHEVELANKQDEIEVMKEQLNLHEGSTITAIKQKDVENQRLREELNNLSAEVQERDGSVSHWKIKHEDINRQINDVEERHTLVIKAKNKEINTLAFQVEELSHQVDKASSVNDAELFRLQSQLKELQRQHTDVLEQNESTIKLKEEEMKRLYSEIGDMSAHLHNVNKDKEVEIQRLRHELSLLKEERDSILTDSQGLVEEKQAEIRKLLADLEKMEVDAAKLHANKQQDVASLRAEYKQKMEQFTTDRAHLIAVKDNEIQNLRHEVDKLIMEAKDGGSSIADMKKRVFNLEQDKAELLMLKDQWQADMDKLYSDYEICKADKLDFERMVDHISKEMEARVEGLKLEHQEELTIKDNHIRDLYNKIEKIAKERGEMSAHLHKVLQDKEQKIESLFAKISEYDKCLDEAEQAFRDKLQKKSQEIKWLRAEIRKMGEEGIRLLDLREREISEMRDHLKNMLKIMEHRAKSKTSSHLIISRPPVLRQSEPHLKPARSTSNKFTVTDVASKTSKKQLQRSKSNGRAGSPTKRKAKH